MAVSRWSAFVLVLALALPAQPASAAAADRRDTRPPTAPGKLAALRVTSTGVTLTWRASADNVGVAAYDVYLGRTLVRSVTGTTAVVDDLVAGTTYAFTVRARDAAGNV